MVTEKIKKKVMDEAMKFLASDRGQKLMQNPQLMQAMMKAMELRGKVQTNFEDGVKNIQKALNLATSEDLRKLGDTLDELRRKLDQLRRQTDALATSLERVKDAAASASASKSGGAKTSSKSGTRKTTK